MALKRNPGDGAVHGARVQVAVVQPLRDGFTDRAFAGCCRPVDGDRLRLVSFQLGYLLSVGFPDDLPELPHLARA
ncbi:MAG: hypothetical protein D6791_09085 [Chloroflexi bacterium]|nr:MAG: hypothetical protein D6791_09085 [Chloroflexota bacterium]